MKGRLILSGGGNEKQTYLLDEVFLKNIKNILYIPVAWKNEDYESCLKWFTNMVSIHKKQVKIDMLVDLSKNIKLENYDAIYIGGGNTFKLLKKIKEFGFNKKLISYYENGGIIYGGSAGAIMLGKDIKTASIGKDVDVNEVNLKNTSGLDLVKSYSIQCHFEDFQISKHQSFIKNSKENIIAIPEESAIIIENNKIKVIGIHPITVIKKDSIKKYNIGEFLII